MSIQTLHWQPETCTQTAPMGTYAAEVRARRAPLSMTVDSQGKFAPNSELKMI